MSQLTTVKTVKNAVLMKDSRGEFFIRIDRVRFSYPFVGTPSEDEGDDGSARKSWRTTVMLPKETHLEAKNLCKEIILGLNKTNEAKVPTDKWFLKDGDESEDENMAGHWLVAAADSKNRPKARDRKGHVIDDIAKIDEVFYGGMWGSILIRPWFFNGKARNSSKTYPKRISANLVGVMFWKDDKPFGSGRVDESEAWDTSGADDEDDGMNEDDENGL
jgi:Protein of unknown function (DUF2815)